MKTNHTKTETPTPDAKTVEIVKQFNDLHVVSIALQSGMIVGNNTEEDCLKAYQRIEEWLTQTLTNLQANAEREKREAVRVATIEAWNDAIELSDRLEESDTKFDEWRAFKGFRNGLRDRIRELVESPNTPD